MADHTSSFSASRRRAWASSRSPAGANASLRPWRSNRRQSSASSSRLICWLAAAWLTPSTEAAAVTPSASTTARKARIREMSRSLRIRIGERLYPKHSFLLSGKYLYPQAMEGKMITGLWLPIVTPFKDGAVDFKSYERLIEHYLELGIDGLFPLGTTGESP